MFHSAHGGGLAARSVNILSRRPPSLVGSALEQASPTLTRGPAPFVESNPHEEGTPPSKFLGGVFASRLRVHVSLGDSTIS